MHFPYGPKAHIGDTCLFDHFGKYGPSTPLGCILTQVSPSKILALSYNTGTIHDKYVCW